MELGDRVRLTREAIRRGVWPVVSRRYLADPEKIRGRIVGYSQKWGSWRIRWDRYMTVETVEERWIEKVMEHR